MSQQPGATPPDPSESIGYALPPQSGAHAGAAGSDQPAYGTPPEDPLGVAGSPGVPGGHGVTGGYEAPGAPPPSSSGGLSKQQIRAIAPMVATILFFVCGFALGGWAWSWIFFLFIPVVMTLTSDPKSRD